MVYVFTGFRFDLLISSGKAHTLRRFFRVRVLVTSFHAQNVSELLRFFGFFDLSIFPFGCLSPLPPPASDCSPDINTLEWGLTFLFTEIAYPQGFCCRCALTA